MPSENIWTLYKVASCILLTQYKALERSPSIFSTLPHFYGCEALHLGKELTPKKWTEYFISLIFWNYNLED